MANASTTHNIVATTSTTQVLDNNSPNGVREAKMYNLSIFDNATGQPTAVLNTTDPKKAKEWYNQQKNNNPNSTTNGEFDTNPFTDGSFGSSADYELGGFEAVECKDVTVDSGADLGQTETMDCDVTGKPLGKTLKDFDPKQSPTSDSGENIIEKATETKEAVDISGVSKVRLQKFKEMSKIERIKRGFGAGFGSMRMQARVNRPRALCEEVIKNKDGNAYIVLGNDRPAKRLTGYGGKGHTQCDMIDIVAGVGGHKPSEVTGLGKKDTNPNFFKDAARIYISQKTDVDLNFGLGKFKETPADPLEIGPHGARSAIALKADNIRIIGRETLHLVTRTDKQNSQGSEQFGKSGIELIANNDPDTLQPIPLGNNLQLLLVIMLDNLEALAKIMHGYVKYQMKFNQALQNHTHHTPFYGKKTLVSKEAIVEGIQLDVATASFTEVSVMKHITNLSGVKGNFLSPSGNTYINSKNNKAN